MKILLLPVIACSLLHSYAQAQEEDASSKSIPSTASLRQMAIEETAAVPSESKSRSSDVSVSGGMLTLKENKPEVHLRSWDYFLALSAQSYSPAGDVTNDYGTRFNLNGESATLMPALTAGFIAPLRNGEELNISWGLGAKVAYSSQNAPVTMPNGYLIDDSRLNTTELSLNPLIRFNAASVSWLNLNLGYILGSLSYAGTSSNDFAKFSRSAAFRGWNAGVDFRLNRSWSLLVDYSHKTLNASNDIDIQNNNIELGTRVQW